jgi:hypothetical protein
VVVYRVGKNNGQVRESGVRSGGIV